MKNIINGKQRLGLIGAGVSLVLVGVWMAWRATTTASSPAGVLAVIPTPAAPSLADQAISRWRDRVAARPKDGDAWVSLGDALMQKARETADASYYGHAERCYRRALDVAPRAPGAITGMAWVYGGRHEFEKSIEWANRAVAIDPKREDPYGLLGDAQVEMGDYDAAFRSYQRMIDCRPDLASYGRGAHLLFLTGDTRKGAWLMGKAIEAGGPYAENTGWCRAQLGLMLWSLGALPGAEQELARALKSTPNNPNLLAAMGRVKMSRRDYAAAIDFYKRAVAVVPQHDSLVALGDVYAATGHRDEAEKQYALVEAIHRINRANGVRGDMQIARFYADHDRNLPLSLREAQEEYRTRKNVFAADTLAWCLYKNGRLAEAKAMIDKALARKTPEPSFYFHAGIIYARLGDRFFAQNHLYHALSLNQNFHPRDAQLAADTLRELGSKAPGELRASR